MTKLLKHLESLRSFLLHGDEKANEDKALEYFRAVFPDFKRQSDASNADGFVPERFILEIKTKKGDWLIGLMQGLSYGRTLSFSSVVVAAKEFLAIWKVSDIPEDIQKEILSSSDKAPSTIGQEFAKKYKARKKEILKKALLNETFGLLTAEQKRFQTTIERFEKTLKEQKKVRKKITLKNFTTILKEMAPFFTEPIKAVRAFYGMLYGWEENSCLELSHGYDDRATLGGETISYILPSQRFALKNYVDDHYIYLGNDEHERDFFPHIDKAIDAVDKEYRIKHGIFFTHLNLAKFAIWYAKQTIPDLGENYFVIDPACGSGNLITSWKSPLKFRFKVASDIEPELVYAVEKRLKSDDVDLGDHSKCMVIPKGNEGQGLNFLDISAKEYLERLKKDLNEKGVSPDKPLAFLCNPPYRGDDNQMAGNAGYAIHQSILDVIGGEGAAERYNCFLAQMKLICDQATSHNLPGNSLLLVFSACGWLTHRPSFQKLRNMIVSSFDFDRGFMINGKEFFEGLTGKFPIAFTIWRYREKQINKNQSSIVSPGRPTEGITLSDLTWLKKKDLDFFKDNHEMGCDEEFQRRGEYLLKDHKTTDIAFGVKRENLRKWSNMCSKDFKKDRRKNERGDTLAGGLPFNDHRRNNTKTYGETSGNFIGFMDDLTPCRIKKAAVNAQPLQGRASAQPSRANAPWFHLNPQFMHVKINRCFSGPHNCRSYHASDLSSAQKCFVWYALARTLHTFGYPMWAASEELWVPSLLSSSHSQEGSFDPADTNAPLYSKLIDYAFAIGFAENECVETVFPAHNPIQGAPEISIANPMTPNNPKSFWNTVMLPSITTKPDLINAVNTIFKEWASRFKDTSEIVAPFQKPYFIEQGYLRKTAGLIQIRHYAEAVKDDVLLKLDETMKKILKATKEEFYDFLTSPTGLNYFGAPKVIPQENVDDKRDTTTNAKPISKTRKHPAKKPKPRKKIIKKQPLKHTMQKRKRASAK